MSTPQSIINICSGVRLDNRYEHSIYFPNANAQQDYFAGKVVKTFSAYSYLRKSWPIQVEATMEQAKTWSYLFFQNGTGKYYYYFITQVEYKNDNMVELTLDLDVLQTYLFDFTMLDCFIDRQHTVSDQMGEHTMEEGLEVGDLVVNAREDLDYYTDLCILVLATINPNYAETTTPVQALAYNYDGVFSGLKVWAVNGTDWAKWGNQLDALTEAGFIDGIVSMWMYPKALVTLGGENTWDDDVLCKVVSGGKSVTANPGTNRNTDNVDGYTPKNRRLFSYPYNFAYVSNNNGTGAVYRYEKKKQPDGTMVHGVPTFKIQGVISPDAPIFMYPANYNSKVANYDEGLMLGGFPTCAWDADVYKLWLAQNQNQHQMALTDAGLKIAGGVVAGVAGAAMGNIALAGGGVMTAMSGAQEIRSQMAQRADMAIQPPQSRGHFSTNLNVAMDRQTFSIYYKSVCAEQARALDDYFTMYGYKVSRVQKPNLCARPAFTYVKTIGCHILGRMCTEDVTKIESIFDRGITFWVNGDKVADYSQDNTV